MNFPEDLPHVLEYRVNLTTRITLCRVPVVFFGSSGRTNAAEVCPQIPVGADAWRRITETRWRPLNTLPIAWMPYLQRARPSEMDPRPPLPEPRKEQQCPPSPRPTSTTFSPALATSSSR